jgi:hypothetical protein
MRRGDREKDRERERDRERDRERKTERTKIVEGERVWQGMNDEHSRLEIAKMCCFKYFFSFLTA